MTGEGAVEITAGRACDQDFERASIVYALPSYIRGRKGLHSHRRRCTALAANSIFTNAGMPIIGIMADSFVFRDLLR
jgi:hypothetical protein